MVGSPWQAYARPHELTGVHAFRVRLRPEQHCGLGLDAYVTATSPIRKYFDLVTQRQIRSLLGLETAYTEKEIEGIILSDEIHPDGLQRVSALIAQYDGFNYTFTKAQQYVEEGKERLQIFPPSRERDALFAGADYVVRRRV